MRSSRRGVICAIPKGDRPELIVQKLTELGLDRIGFMTTARTVVRWDERQVGGAARAAATDRPGGGDAEPPSPAADGRRSRRRGPRSSRSVVRRWPSPDGARRLGETRPHDR